MDVNWPLVTYSGAFLAVAGAAGLLWAGIRRLVRFEDSVIEVPEIKKQLGEHVASEQKLVSEISPLLKQIRGTLDELQGQVRALDGKFHEHGLVLARTDQQLQALAHQFDAHEAKDDQRFIAEREDRHDLRTHVDGRLRGLETDVARMQGSARRLKPREDGA